MTQQEKNIYTIIKQHKDIFKHKIMKIMGLTLWEGKIIDCLWQEEFTSGIWAGS